MVRKQARDLQWKIEKEGKVIHSQAGGTHMGPALKTVVGRMWVSNVSVFGDIGDYLWI
jgi:hypothetical protein